MRRLPSAATAVESADTRLAVSAGLELNPGMHPRFRRVVLLLTVAAATPLLVSAAAFAPQTTVAIADGRWVINGGVTHPGSPAEGLLMNVRMVNATFEDRNRQDFDPEANTRRFLARLPEYAAQGVRAFTLNLQGGMPGYEGALNSAFNPDGSSRAGYLRRVGRVIEACDRAGTVVILGCFYQRQDQVLRDEAAVRVALVNAVRWIHERGFRNVVLEVSNEFDHGGFDHRVLKGAAGQVELMGLARQTMSGLLVSTSGLGHGRIDDPVAEEADFLLIHFNGTPVRDIPARIAALKRFGKPIVCNEDDKVGEEAALAARGSVANGASWGFMHKAVNQYQPFEFHGVADDPVVYAALADLTSPSAQGRRAGGPLRVHPDNPRYFIDDRGQTVLLTGSHTWNNLVDMLPADGGKPFDYAAWLDFMERYDQNFMRLWRWELVKWDTAANRQQEPRTFRVGPHPWVRSGPGLALDGLPKFDLSKLDAPYFQRLRERVQAAGERGVYAAVMLFEGWGLQFVEGAWKAHPFHPANHVNGLDADANGDGKGLEVHELGNAAVLAIQEAYVRRVIDTLNDLDNVLYEISNENHPPSTKWQYRMIRLIQDYERGKPKQHPVGMTFQYKDGRNSDLFASPADWVSPNQAAADGFSYRDNPPPADGGKIVISDTDHLWGIGGNVAWVWKTFLRGHHPIFMDRYDGVVLSNGRDAEWEPIRQAMGVVHRLSREVDLAKLRPHPELAHGGFCLADPGRTYVVWAAKGQGVTLDAPATKGRLRLQRIDPIKGPVGEVRRLESGDEIVLGAEDAGDAVWLLQNE